MRKKSTIDRSAVMRHARALMKSDGLSFGEAQRRAWAMAKAGNGVAVIASAPAQQPSGVKACMTRYGLDRIASYLADRARAFVAQIGRNHAPALTYTTTIDLDASEWRAE